MLYGWPPVAITHPTPPQITGFQTSNKVRTLAHVESTLFNLVYNTNGVFIELYEDAIWRIGITRGTGPSADPLDGPTLPTRGAGCTLAFCYSKNLSRWAEELHWRREQITALWGVYDGITYRQYDEPFPDEYVVAVDTEDTIHYINPSRCTGALIDDSGDPLAASALGVIEVVP
jgi:hypothetical protein